MGKSLRIVLGIGAAVIAAVAALLVAVALLVDPDDYRERIAATVRDATGRDLVLGGPLSLDLWPCCSLALADAALGNPPGFPEEPFVRVREAALGLKLWPLLTERRLAVGRITLRGLDANLVTRADGVSNWSFATADAAAEATPATPDGPPLALDLAGITVSDGALTWRDARDGTDYAVRALTIETGPVRGAEAFPLTAGLTFTDRSDQTAGDLALDATIGVDADKSRVTLTGLTSRLALRGPAVPTATLELTAPSATLDYAADPVLALAGLAGKVTSDANADLPAIAGDFSAANAVLRSGTTTSVELPALRTRLVLTGKDLPGGEARVAADLQGLEFGTGPFTGQFAGLAGSVTAAGARADITGAGRFGDATDVAGTFTLPPFPPRALLKALDLEPAATADPGVLKTLAGRGRYRYTDDQLALDELALTLDDTRISGSLAQSLGEPARTRFDLTLDRLDADRYLAPEASPPAAGSATSEASTDLPVATLRDLRLNGRLRAGALTWDGLKLGNVDLTVVADNGRVRFDPLRLGLYGGSLAGSASIDATGDRARIGVRQKLRDIQLGPFLGDFADVRNITGRLVADIDLAGSGRTTAELKQDLDGRLDLSIADGVYRGLDVWGEIRRARAVLRREPVPAKPADPQTVLKAVELAGPVAKGLLTTDKFIAEIPFLRLSGNLGLDLAKEAIRGDLQALIFAAPTFDDGTTLPDLVGARLPLTVKGPLASPKVGVDFSKMVREAARGAAKEQLKSLQNRVLERLGLGGAAAPEAPPAGDNAAPADPAAPPPPPKKKESSGDRVRGLLDQLLKPPPEE